MEFFKVKGQWFNTQRMKAYREEQVRLAQIFCDWCVSKAVRNLKDCPTKLADFIPENTPKLTKEDREILIKQKNETLN